MPSKFDFNPYLRDQPEFLSLRKPSIFAQLKSVLAAPVKIKGIDVSHWNGTVDWKKVRESGIDFAIIKATEGTGFLDPRWEYNWREAINHEIIAMPYHFFRDQYKGNPQLTWFLQNADIYLQEVDGKTIVWADVETDNGSGITARQNRLHGFCLNAVGKGLQAGYYSSKWKWESLIGNPPWANDFWQWPASWTPNSTYVLPTGWTSEKSKWWQFGIYPAYSWTFPVSGAGTVDVNWFLGTIQELRDILGQTSPPPVIDCCDEVKAEIAFLIDELNALNEIRNEIKRILS